MLPFFLFLSPNSIFFLLLLLLFFIEQGQRGERRPLVAGATRGGRREWPRRRRRRRWLHARRARLGRRRAWPKLLLALTMDLASTDPVARPGRARAVRDERTTANRRERGGQHESGAANG